MYNLTCFGQIYCLSSGFLILYSQQLVFVIQVMLTVCQRGCDGVPRIIKTPDDGQYVSPKHVEFYIKTKLEILHLFGFYYTNITRCTVLRMSDFLITLLPFHFICYHPSLILFIYVLLYIASDTLETSLSASHQISLRTVWHLGPEVITPAVRQPQ